MGKTETLAPAKGKRHFYYGYVIIIAGFFAVLAAFGCMYSFGVFFKPVSAEFGWSRAETAGAYSMYMAIHGLACVLMGKLGDRFNPRIVLSICGVMLGSGFLLMHWLSSLWQFYIYYGVFVSTGIAGYVPLLSVVARWFDRRRGLMSGFVVAGIGIGITVMPPLATQLISSYGWSMSYLIIGLVALFFVVGAAQFLRSPVAAADVPAGKEFRARGVTFTEAIRSQQFWLYSLALIGFMFAQQMVMVHIVPHATDIGIPAVTAASVLSMVGGLSIAGRVGMGALADRLDSRLSLLISYILLVVGLICLLAARDLASLYMFALIFGVGYDGIIVLQSPAIGELFGLRSHGTIMGATALMSAIGGALGPQLAGRIFDSTGSYQTAFILAAAMGGGGLIFVIRLRRSRRHVALE